MPTSQGIRRYVQEGFKYSDYCKADKRNISHMNLFCVYNRYAFVIRDTSPSENIPEVMVHLLKHLTVEGTITL